MNRAELQEVADEHGWELRGKHGRFILKNEHFVVKYHSLGAGVCEVHLRGIDEEYVGIDAQLSKDNILPLLVALDADYAEKLFTAKAEIGIDDAKAAMRRAQRDKRDIEKMLAGWKKRHGL